jgi:hypothetical protein
LSNTTDKAWLKIGDGLQKGKSGKFEEATRRVTDENLPSFVLCKPPQDQPGLWQLHLL